MLEATAKMESGATLKSILKGDPKKRVLRLPKSRTGSWIADSWRDRMGAPGDDDSDDEEDPVGDGTKGDGLTLFEEYRGIREDGFRVSGFPKKKDLFIVDPVGGRTKEAFRRFAALSGLQVHSLLREDEISPSRVVNPNGTGGPHLVDQHALLIRMHQPTGYCIAEGGPGTPKKIKYIGLSPDFKGPDFADYWIQAAVHELFHSVNVWHHGDIDVDQTWSVRPGADGALRIYANGAELQVFAEPKTPYRPPQAVEEWAVTIGVPQGQNSGFEDCVMRYNIADVARQPDGTLIKVPVDYAKMGHSLCSQGTGVSFNKDPRPEGPLWRPRHWQAGPTRGTCSKQIVVNDAAAEKTR
jgi:hypothetical protein